MCVEERRRWQYQNGFGISPEMLIEGATRLGMLTGDHFFTPHFLNWYEWELKRLFDTPTFEWVTLVIQGYKRAMQPVITHPCLLENLALLLIKPLKEKEESFLRLIKPKGLRLAHLYILFATILIDQALAEGVLVVVGEGLYTLSPSCCVLPSRHPVGEFR